MANEPLTMLERKPCEVKRAKYEICVWIDEAGNAGYDAEAPNTWPVDIKNSALKKLGEITDVLRRGM